MVLMYTNTKNSNHPNRYDSQNTLRIVSFIQKGLPHGMDVDLCDFVWYRDGGAKEQLGGRNFPIETLLKFYA
jgi:hypothetical protein